MSGDIEIYDDFSHHNPISTVKFLSWQPLESSTMYTCKFNIGIEWLENYLCKFHRNMKGRPINSQGGYMWCGPPLAPLARNGLGILTWLPILAIIL
jgi:hypothetical protein